MGSSPSDEPAIQRASNSTDAATMVEPEEPAPAVATAAGDAASVLSREKFQPGMRFYGAFGSLLIVNFAAALDATSLSVALPIISSELGGTAIEAFWSGTSFLLASTLCILSFASASQLFGRKALTLTSLILFAVGSVVAAAAPNFTALLAGRTIQGAGAGGILCLAEVIITDLVPLRERGKWFGIQGGVWALGSVLGPLIGGILADHGQWRWIFWLNLPIIGLGIVAVAFFLRLNPVPGKLLPKLARFDWVGFILFTAAGTSFLMPVTWGNVVFPWSSWRTIVPLVLGAAGLAAFLVYEAKVAREPIVRLAIFERRSAMVNYLGTFIHGVVLWSLLYYMPLYYECVKGYGSLLSGVAIMPHILTITPISIVVGVLISRLGRFRWAIWTGWAVGTFGMGLLYLLGPDTTVPQWIFLNLVSGLGLGMLFNSLNYGVVAAAEERDVAYAASMYIFSRAFGQGVGVAIGGAIFQNQFDARLRAYPELASRASELTRDASGLVETVRAMPADSPERRMIITAYADSLKVIWAVMAGLAFVAFVASLLTEKMNITRAMETTQGLREKPVGRGAAESTPEEA